ncbi:hypothetical protein ACFV2Q_06490 [Streptomyces sp. NPDC059650]|uniref:hypothetical protein n=1 Tax=Streptomyces sp. NPDC059650 TaxID=3346896 RepID=UPI0036A6D56E
MGVREALADPVRRLGGPELAALTGPADGDREPCSAQFAALVLGTAQEDAEAALDALVDGALPELSGRDAQGRPPYRCHDLVRLLAATLTTRELDAGRAVPALPVLPVLPVLPSAVR